MQLRRTMTVAMLAAGAVLLAVPGAMAQHADDEPSLRLYDVRDLAAVLPTAHDLNGDQSEAEYLLSRLCDANGLPFEALLAGVIAVEGTEDEHARLRDQLDQVQALYTERFEVTVVAYSASGGEVPAVGDEVRPTEVLRETRQVVQRRQPTVIKSITTHTYVADVIPIVGDGAMGYDPETMIINEGLELQVLIGAGDERGGAVPMRVSGELSKVEIRRSSGLWPGADSPVTIDLPVARRRSIESSVCVTPGKLTALSVVDGFVGDEVVVLAAAVRKME